MYLQHSKHQAFLEHAICNVSDFETTRKPKNKFRKTREKNKQAKQENVETKKDESNEKNIENKNKNKTESERERETHIHTRIQKIPKIYSKTLPQMNGPP
jgi:IS4 transposase